MLLDQLLPLMPMSLALAALMASTQNLSLDFLATGFCLAKNSNVLWVWIILKLIYVVPFYLEAGSGVGL